MVLIQPNPDMVCAGPPLDLGGVLASLSAEETAKAAAQKEFPGAQGQAWGLFVAGVLENLATRWRAPGRDFPWLTSSSGCMASLAL